MVSTIRLDLLELFGKSYILDHIQKKRSETTMKFNSTAIAWQMPLAGLRGPTLFILTLLRTHSRFM